MNKSDIIALQKRVGTAPDSFWGPKSIAATQRHLRRLMPSVSPWPKQDEDSLTAFYGPAYSEARLVNASVTGLGVFYEGRLVRTVRCHECVADSLVRVLRAISKGPDAFVLKFYGGCWNPRKMTGGTRPSLHARGAAIDLWPEKNGNNTHWPTRAMMPVTVMEEFAKEGWLSAGAFWSRDACHFQATQ